MRRTHDIQLVQTSKPKTTKLEEVNKKRFSEDGNTQTQSIQNVTGTQSILDTLTLMRGSKSFSN